MRIKASRDFARCFFICNTSLLPAYTLSKGGVTMHKKITAKFLLPMMLFIIASFSSVVVQAVEAGETLDISWQVYVFEEPDFASERLGSFEPQMAVVFEQYGDWSLVILLTSHAVGWINLNFPPPTQELDNLLRRFGNDLSVYYENLETGFVYQYNADRVYFSASVPKASFALYIYQKLKEVKQT